MSSWSIINLILSCTALIQATAPMIAQENETSSVSLPPVYNISNFVNDCSVRIHGDCTGMQNFCDVILAAMNYTCNPDPITEHEAVATSRKYVLKCEETINKTNILDKSCENVKHISRVVVLASNLRSKYPFNDLPENPGLEREEGALLADYSKLVAYLYSIKKRIAEAELLMPKLFHVLDYINENGLAGIFTSQISTDVLKISEIENITERLKLTIESEKGAENVHIVVAWIFPIISAVEFLIGVVGNGLLLAIFIQNKSMRKSNNVMFINLAVVDILSLTINLPLAVTAVSKPWWSNITFCLFHRFFLNFPVFVSTFCLVFLSFQRYHAVSSVTTFRNRKNRIIYGLVTPIIWFLGIIYASMHLIHLHVPDGESVCSTDEPYSLCLSIIDFLVICVTPVVLIAVFSIFTTIHIKKSVSHFPGSKKENIKQLNDRTVTSRILIGLLILFIFSYVPNGLFHVLAENGIIFEVKSHNDVALFLALLYGTNNLLFLNSTLHPLLLYFLSRKFRKCYKSLLYCNYNSEIKNVSLTTTQRTGINGSIKE